MMAAVAIAARTAVALSASLCVLLAACAAQNEAPPPLLTSTEPVPNDVATIRAAPGGYTLTAEEAKLDCPKLTGRMRVKIANMRDASGAPATSVAGRTAQAATAPIMGHSSRGASPVADLQRERAQLEAFNKRLAEKKCTTLDLDAELRGQAPPPPPPKSTKTKA